jgi:hypothetical protein
LGHAWRLVRANAPRRRLAAPPMGVCCKNGCEKCKPLSVQIAMQGRARGAVAGHRLRQWQWSRGEAVKGGREVGCA